MMRKPVEQGSSVEMKGKEKRNKYACACSIVASMISLLLGYGNSLITHFIFFMFIYIYIY